MAVELPIVGTVHEASATGGFVRKLGLASCGDLLRTGGDRRMAVAARASRAAGRSKAPDPATPSTCCSVRKSLRKTLKRALDKIAQPGTYSPPLARPQILGAPHLAGFSRDVGYSES